MKRFLTLTALMLIPGFALAHDYQIGDIYISHPTTFETAKTAKAGGGYLIIVNEGENDDALIGVEADFPRVMLHQTTETDGIARMSHVERLDIPAGEAVELVPGGYHVMFMGLDGPFEEGQSIPATLIFEEAGEIDINFKVQARKHHNHGTDHSNHGDHGGHSDHSGHEHSE